MRMRKYSRHVIFITGLVGALALFSRCSSGSSGSGTALTTSGKITSGLGSATETLQGMGNALANGNSSFASGGNQIMSATTSCTIHGEPGNDSNANGTVEDGERYSTNHTNYALQKFYCTLAAETSGPESVAGAVNLIKTVACAVDKQLGGITFDGNPVAVSTITIDTTCASATMLQDMNGGSPTSIVTMNLPSTITAMLNPNFAELGGVTGHYSHGIKIASNDGTSLKFIIVAKFDDSIAGDPLENGDFEFATLGTGTQMQGTAIEYTAGKLDRTSSNAGTLWYESRHNRIKTTAGGGGSAINDPVCRPGEASSSCGFVRHTRLRTDITFTGGDISDVSNLSGIISEGYDNDGSGQSGDFSFIITATGSLTSGITGREWESATAPGALGGASLNAGIFASAVSSCVFSGGSITTACGSAPAALVPAGTVDAFFMPPNSNAWFGSVQSGSGLGFSGAANLNNAQTAL